MSLDKTINLLDADGTTVPLRVRQLDDETVIFYHYEDKRLPIGSRKTGTITAANTSQSVAAENANRLALVLQNTSDTVMYVNQDGAAATTSDFKVSPGEYFKATTSNEVTIICASAGKTFAAIETDIGGSILESVTLAELEDAVSSASASASQAVASQLENETIIGPTESNSIAVSTFPIGTGIGDRSETNIKMWGQGHLDSFEWTTNYIDLWLSPIAGTVKARLQIIVRSSNSTAGPGSAGDVVRSDIVYDLTATATGETASYSSGTIVFERHRFEFNGIKKATGDKIFWKLMGLTSIEDPAPIRPKATATTVASVTDVIEKGFSLAGATSMSQVPSVLTTGRQLASTFGFSKRVILSKARRVLPLTDGKIQNSKSGLNATIHFTWYKRGTDFLVSEQEVTTTHDGCLVGSVTSEPVTLSQTAVTLANRHISNVSVRRVSNNALLVEGTDYKVLKDLGMLKSYTATTTPVTVSYSYEKERYDIVSIHPERFTISVTKGTERSRDAVEYQPEVPITNIEIARVKVVGTAVSEIIPTGERRGFAMVDQEADYNAWVHHNRKCNAKFIGRVQTGSDALVIGYGDSWTGSVGPSFFVTYPSDTLDDYTSDQLAALTIPNRIADYVESKYGVNVEYQNLGVGGTTSDTGMDAGGGANGRETTRLANAVSVAQAGVTAGKAVLVVCSFAMNDRLKGSYANDNDRSDATIANLKALKEAFEAVGATFMLTGCGLVHPEVSGTLTYTEPAETSWRVNRTYQRAAVNTNCAIANLSMLNGYPVTWGSMGIARYDYSLAQGYNHPGIFELKRYGDFAIDISGI